MGKSAQLFLHTWLPDAEGPTPVQHHSCRYDGYSRFPVCRMSPLMEFAPNAMAFITFIGATTAFFAATIGLVQNDIKRVIAYSTCSQLGYMFVAAGSGVYSAAMFHLFTHAFFKALLFLGAGSVIHAMHHEQDMRNYGGLRKKYRTLLSYDDWNISNNGCWYSFNALRVCWVFVQRRNNRKCLRSVSRWLLVLDVGQWRCLRLFTVGG